MKIKNLTKITLSCRHPGKGNGPKATKGKHTWTEKQGQNGWNAVSMGTGTGRSGQIIGAKLWRNLLRTEALL